MSAEAAEFTPSERNEIIGRMQAMENRLEAMDATLAEVHAFNMRLAQVLDGLGGNPMFAAMMPPDVAANMMAGN